MSAAIETAAQAPAPHACAGESERRHNVAAFPIDAVIYVLRELHDFIESISDKQYTRKPIGPINSSMGGHVRHSLDHVGALLSAARSGDLNYDARDRGTPTEHSRSAALELMRQQERELFELRSDYRDRRLRLSVLLSPEAPPLETTTTLSRELAFVVSHTVHHNSLLAVAAALLGVRVPARFGYAPATLAWMDQSKCAR